MCLAAVSALTTSAWVGQSIPAETAALSAHRTSSPSCLTLLWRPPSNTSTVPSNSALNSLSVPDNMLRPPPIFPLCCAHTCGPPDFELLNDRRMEWSPVRGHLTSANSTSSSWTKLAEVELGRTGRSRNWPKSSWPKSKKQKHWPKSKLTAPLPFTSAQGSSSDWVLQWVCRSCGSSTSMRDIPALPAVSCSQCSTSAAIVLTGPLDAVRVSAFPENSKSLTTVAVPPQTSVPPTPAPPPDNDPPSDWFSNGPLM